MNITLEQWETKLSVFEARLHQARHEMMRAVSENDVEGMTRALAARDRAQACVDVLWEIAREGGI